MSILDWLRGAPARSETRGDTDTVRRIVAELDRLEPARARYLAAFAYVLSRVARADLRITAVETEKMVETLRGVGRLSDEQAVLVVEIAKTQNRLFGGTEDFLVTREFREIATDDQRRELVDSLFAVAAADDEISTEEEAAIREIATELGFSHPEFVQMRLPYSDKRTIFRQDRR